MEKYKKTLKARIGLLTLLALVGVALSIYDVFFTSDNTKNSFVFGFQTGLSVALGIMAMIAVVLYRDIMTNETKMQQQYNRENDERLKAVKAKAGLPMLLVTSVGIIIAGIFVGYYDQTAFIALIVAATCQLLFAVITKQIYMRKM